MNTLTARELAADALGLIGEAVALTGEILGYLGEKALNLADAIEGPVTESVIVMDEAWGYDPSREDHRQMAEAIRFPSPQPIRPHRFGDRDAPYKRPDGDRRPGRDG